MKILSTMTAKNVAASFVNFTWFSGYATAHFRVNSVCSCRHSCTYTDTDLFKSCYHSGYANAGNLVSEKAPVSMSANSTVGDRTGNFCFGKSNDFSYSTVTGG